MFLQIFNWQSWNHFLGKWVRQNVQHCWNQDLVIGSLLENGFGATLSSKKNALSIWKDYFSVFYEFFTDKVETIFGES